MPERSITESIDLSKSHLYTLSIRLSTDGFSFCIFDPSKKEVVYYFSKDVEQSLSFASNIKKICNELEILNKPYREVNVILVDRRFTLLPYELFDEEQARDIFYYNLSKKENEQVLSHYLKKGEVIVLFGIDKSTHHYLKAHFPEVRFYSQVGSLMEYFARVSKSDRNRMFAYLRGKAIDLYCYGDDQLILANSFECKNKDDQMYYLLYIWKQLGMDQEKDELYLTGEIIEIEEIQQDLQRFIQYVSIIDSVITYDLTTYKKGGNIPLDIQALLFPES